MKRPIDRLADLERVMLFVQSVHPGLFAGIPDGIMPAVPDPDEGGEQPEPTSTPDPTVGGAPAPNLTTAPTPAADDEDESDNPPPGPGPDPVTVPPAVQARGRRGGRS